MTLKFSILDFHFVTKTLLYWYTLLLDSVVLELADSMVSVVPLTVEGLKEKSKYSIVIHILKLRN